MGGMDYVLKGERSGSERTFRLSVVLGGGSEGVGGSEELILTSQR